MGGLVDLRSSMQHYLLGIYFLSLSTFLIFTLFYVFFYVYMFYLKTTFRQVGDC